MVTTTDTDTVCPILRKGVSKISELYKHQQKSIDKFLPLTRTFDTSDPGTGKTRVALELLRRRDHKAIVLCPKTLMEVAWVDDAAKFAPNMIVMPIYAGKKREQFIKFDADVFVFNSDAVKFLVTLPEAFFKRFDCIILDESTAFKNHKSMRSKAVAQIVKHFKYRHLMTGTPNSNSITDIWHQVFLLDDGETLGTSFYSFRHHMCSPVIQGGFIKHVDKEEAPALTGVMLRDFTIRHEFEECVSIPPNVIRKVFVPMNDSHRREYEKFKKYAKVEVASGAVVGINAAAMATKLLQIASGAAYTSDDSSSPTHTFSTDRYDTIAQMVAERDHSIVFFLWAHQREELIKAIEKQGISDYAIIDGTITKGRSDIVRNFQDGQYRTLLLHPQSAAHGITLTRATATIWASPTYNAEWWKQGFHRMIRAGQENQTETILVSAKDTIDERVFDIMQSKNDRMATLLDMIAE